MERIELFTEPPANWTYSEIQPQLLDRVRLFLKAARQARGAKRPAKADVAMKSVGFGCAFFYSLLRPDIQRKNLFLFYNTALPGVSNGRYPLTSIGMVKSVSGRLAASIAVWHSSS